MASVKFSTILNKYPTFRDDTVKGCWKWLNGRRADDNAEGYWRVHDKLYDLKDFVDKHPGGQEWLILTEGTDITEAFESYHITDKASHVLSNFFVRDSSKPRNYNLTYDVDGFYKTLKRRVAKKLPTLDRSSLWKSKFYLDMVVVAVFLTAIFAMRAENYLLKILMILISGQFFGWVNTMSHNFIHQRNNWRMFTANLVLTGWRDWRVYHGLSHHLYPNSYSDFEISAYEPYFSWIPIQKKTRLSILFSYLATPFVYAFLFHGTLTLRLFGLLLSKNQKFHWDEVTIPLTLPLSMFVFGKLPLTLINVLWIFFVWNCIILVGSFTYSVIAVNAGHHGPTIIHEGDDLRGLDYGLFQLGATIDRVEVKTNLFVSLTHFGNHMLHHMFPSLDHSLLPQLESTLLETCEEFKEQLKEFTIIEAVIAQFQQLSRRKTIKRN